MFRLLKFGVLTLTLSFLAAGEVAVGGDLGRILHPQRDCGCHGPGTPVFAAPPMAVPALHSGCHCGQAAASCCGLGGGLAFAGVMAGMESGYGGWSPGPGAGFLSGYEGLPNMDGGGIHYRYPYHSYRRPWAHPGPHSVNVSIVW